ncbi:hypothetical protein, partial [uncultured Roseovarius sp.]|uniref:hypothetical protein n=1 Tax=uncultured Roseovarius sp. TaxID=293344 RepID=UPI0025E03387
FRALLNLQLNSVFPKNNAAHFIRSTLTQILPACWQACGGEKYVANKSLNGSARFQISPSQTGSLHWLAGLIFPNPEQFVPLDTIKWLDSRALSRRITTKFMNCL